MSNAAAPGGLFAFLGPSLPAEEAMALVPGVELLPPIRQADLSTLLEFRRPRAVLIVDGEFGQSLSVWHKEILRAIDEGVRVIGASSMGALRAAELHRFGMEGVGAVFEFYRDGWLTSDADVALLYGDAESGYRPMSWPLVNVRATVAALQERGELDVDLATTVLAAAASVHFRERDHLTVAEALVEAGVALEEARSLGQRLREGYVDQKRRDAVAGLQRLAAIDVLPPPERDVPRHLYGRIFDALRWTDVHLERREGRLRRYQLVNDVALHHPGFEDLLARAVDRYALLEFAAELEIRPTEEELARARRDILRRLDLDDDAAVVDAWRQQVDLDAAGFEQLVAQRAAISRLRGLVLDSRLYERTRRMVIEQLQLEGQYPAAVDAAARRRQFADAQPPPPFPTHTDDMIALIARQMAVSGWQAYPDLVTVADEHGFEGLPGVLVALGDSAAASVTAQERRARVAAMFGFGGGSAGTAAAAGPNAATGSAATGAAGVGRSEPDGTYVHAVLESYQVSFAVIAAVELGVFVVLGADEGDGVTTETMAGALGVEVGLAARLLDALRSLRLVTRDGDTWTVTPDGRWLTPGRVDSLAPYALDVKANAVAAWASLPAVLRGDRPTPPVDPALADVAIAAATGALGFVDAVIAAVPFPEGARVVDVGGGLGRLAAGLVVARDDLDVTVVELGDTARRAADALDAQGLGDRVRVLAADDPAVGDLRADVVVLQRVLVNLDEDRAVALLGQVRSMLAEDGIVVVVDVEADGTAGPALGDLLNLARSGGTVRSDAGWTALAERAGFTVVDRQSLRRPFALRTLRPIGDER